MGGKKPKAFEVQPRDLIDIVAHNEVILLDLALQEDTPKVLSYRDQYGVSALHVAVCHNHPILAEMLINAGADVNAQTDCGWTPLHQAAEEGLVALAEMLLRAGARADIVNADFELPIQLARRNHYSRVVVLLTPYVEPLFTASRNAFAAAAAGDLLFFINLCDATKLEVGESFRPPIELSGTDPESKETILTALLKQPELTAQHSGLLEFILSRNLAPVINTANVSRMTPLMLAAKYGHVAAARALLKHNADPTVSYDDEVDHTAASLARDPLLQLELLAAERTQRFETKYAIRDSVPYDDRPRYVAEVKRLRREMLQAKEALAQFLAPKTAPTDQPAPQAAPPPPAQQTVQAAA